MSSDSVSWIPIACLSPPGLTHPFVASRARTLWHTMSSQAPTSSCRQQPRNRRRNQEPRYEWLTNTLQTNPAAYQIVSSIQAAPKPKPASKTTAAKATKPPAKKKAPLQPRNDNMPLSDEDEEMDDGVGPLPTINKSNAAGPSKKSASQTYQKVCPFSNHKFIRNTSWFFFLNSWLNWNTYLSVLILTLEVSNQLDSSCGFMIKRRKLWLTRKFLSYLVFIRLWMRFWSTLLIIRYFVHIFVFWNGDEY